MNLDSLTMPDAHNLRYEVTKMIVNKFGISKAAFFFQKEIRGSGNYLEIKEEIFQEKSADDIFNEIQNWRRKQ